MKRTILFFLVELGQWLSKWAARCLGGDILRDALTEDEIQELCLQDTEGWDPTECELYNDPAIIRNFRAELSKQWGRG